MRRFGAIVSLLLALLWAPLTSHCLLEDAGLIHHDACCEGRPAAAAGHGHDAADGLCRVESSSYQLPKPHLALAPLLADGSGAAALPPAVPGPARALAPPEAADSPPHLLAVTWQFLARAALAPRAPSLPL